MCRFSLWPHPHQSTSCYTFAFCLSQKMAARTIHLKHSYHLDSHGFPQNIMGTVVLRVVRGPNIPFTELKFPEFPGKRDYLLNSSGNCRSEREARDSQQLPASSPLWGDGGIECGSASKKALFVCSILIDHGMLTDCCGRRWKWVTKGNR